MPAEDLRKQKRTTQYINWSFSFEMEYVRQIQGIPIWTKLHSLH
jgi:hypothetical protein